MESLRYLMYGFSVALTPVNILWTIIGCSLGTVLGMLPGVGPATGIALLLPLSFTMKPVTAIVTMCGVFYGAMFGGSRSSILLNIPGDASAVVSCFDGYPMAKNGQAEAALAISAIASFIGTLLAGIAFVFAALPIARFALRFGPPEYFTLMVFALAATASISKGSILKGLISLVFGLMITTVGIDLQSGVQRFVFGIPELQTGIEFVIVIIGVYGLGEVFKNFERIKATGGAPIQTKFKRIWITMEQWRRSIGPILRQTPVGFFVGVLPGTGGAIATMMAYNNEKQLSKEPDRFGKGAIEGLAAPEAANNACSIGAVVTTLTLGVPGSATAALLLGALMIAGLQPGPLLFQQHPEIGWGVIASLFVGNFICAVINIPLAGLLVRVLSVPPKILYPLIVGLAFMGVYTINLQVMDFYLVVIFGIIGYFMKKYRVPAAPLILAVVVGGSLEQSFRQSLMLSDGEMGIFFRSGICITLWILAVVFLLYPYLSDYLKARRQRSAASPGGKAQA